MPVFDTPLMVAARTGDLAQLDVLLAHETSRPACTQALWAASAAGQLAAVKRLIPVSDVASEGALALQEATAAGHAEVVRALIPWSPARRRGLMLKLAARLGWTDTVLVLAPGRTPAQVGAALKEAVRQEMVPLSTVEALLQHRPPAEAIHQALLTASMAGRSAFVDGLARHVDPSDLVPLFTKCLNLYEAGTTARDTALTGMRELSRHLPLDHLDTLLDRTLSELSHAQARLAEVSLDGALPTARTRPRARL